MTIGSLFSGGVGGLELGLEWAGLGPTVYQVEVDRDCRANLARHWPNVRRFSYVQAVAAHPERLPDTDIICGGVPCQGASVAGKGLGLDDHRTGLWRYMRDIIEAKRPRVVVIENVPGLVRRGLDAILGDLRALDYEVEGTRLRAGDVGAPHRRERIFVIGYRLADTSGNVLREQLGGERSPSEDGCLRRGEAGKPGVRGKEVANPDSRRRAQPKVGVCADGVTNRLDNARWPAGRGIHQYDWEPSRVVRSGSIRGRPAQLKMLGNAVVPYCAYVVGMRIRQKCHLSG